MMSHITVQTLKNSSQIRLIEIQYLMRVNI